MIYIDPPYNTGQDFVYPDDYSDPMKVYLKITGQVDEGGNLTTSNPETSGRYHSSWLSLMYPRLFFARHLLQDDGVICVSIDDNEIHHLRMLMNEIFGEENYYATIAWQKKDTPSNDSKSISTTHEYILIYQRSEEFQRNLLPRTEEQLGNYKNPDNDPRGPWTRTTLIRKEVRPNRVYKVPTPQGEERLPPPGTSWRVPPEKFEKYIADNKIWWGEGADNDLPFLKRFLSEVKPGVVPVTWWDYKFAGSNRNAKMEIRELFDREVPFETPKPASLVKQLLRIMTDPAEEAVVLDFFAGSGTTAQAVLELNHEDGGNRRFILVQLPQATKHGNYSTISNISKERIRRAIAKIKKTGSAQAELLGGDLAEDIGFKVFSLSQSSIRQWIPDSDRDPEVYAQRLLQFRDPLIAGWKFEDTLWELILREGYSLNTEFKEVALSNGNTIYEAIDQDKGQGLAICLDEKINVDLGKHYSFNSELVFICRDVALDDTAAANLALQCRLKVI